MRRRVFSFLQPPVISRALCTSQGWDCSNPSESGASAPLEPGTSDVIPSRSPPRAARQRTTRNLLLSLPQKHARSGRLVHSLTRPRHRGCGCPALAFFARVEITNAGSEFFDSRPLLRFQNKRRRIVAIGLTGFRMPLPRRAASVFVADLLRIRFKHAFLPSRESGGFP